ncbi:MAG TPA: hypothetical protein VIJ93_04015 [bacterium]
MKKRKQGLKNCATLFAKAMNPELMNDPEFAAQVEQLEQDFLDEKEREYVSKKYLLNYSRARIEMFLLGIPIGSMLIFAFFFLQLAKKVPISEVECVAGFVLSLIALTFLFPNSHD